MTNWLRNTIIKLLDLRLDNIPGTITTNRVVDSPEVLNAKRIFEESQRRGSVRLAKAFHSGSLFADPTAVRGRSS